MTSTGGAVAIPERADHRPGAQLLPWRVLRWCWFTVFAEEYVRLLRRLAGGKPENVFLLLFAHSLISFKCVGSQAE
jgi:hypothetical protein